MIILFTVMLLVLLATGLPVGFALGTGGLVGMLLFMGGDGTLNQIPLLAYKSLDDFVLCAVPLYVLMSQILLEGKVGNDLFELGNKWLRHLPGGLGAATIVACGIFAAITGSSAACAVTIGAIAIPEMLKRNYERTVVLGAVAAGGTLGILIPPSIPMILYGAITGESIGQLFMSGVIPGFMLTIFFILDSKNKVESQIMIETQEKKVVIKGYLNLILLFLVICSLFINKNFVPSLPSFSLFGHEICLIRELILTLILLCACKINNKETLKANNFSYEPIQELAILFLGIFITMAPVICIIEEYVKTINQSYITPSLLFWVTGLFSSLLDNAPTYLNMLTASMTANSFDINTLQNVIEYAKTATCIPALSAISIAAIFFGSITYISNGPNFMVKKIAEKNDVKMPSFFAFVLKYSLPILIGPFLLIWLFFYR